MTVGASTSQPDPLPVNRLTAAFERRVARVLTRHVQADVPLVVAVSGGPDSTALLVACVRARARAGPSAAPTVAACFDHGLRPAVETARDRAFVQTLARALGVRASGGGPHARAIPRGEAAARGARYRWLAGVCAEAGADTCVTGHTLDDQAETVLLRLTRGAGLAGAAGIAEAGAWPVDAEGGRDRCLRVVRPLLALSRDDVLDYLDALELQPREDETNALLTFDRNRIRHRVLPELRTVNPGVAAQLAQFAAQARGDDEALVAWATRELAEHARFDGPEVSISRVALAALPPSVASRLLRSAAGRIGLRLTRSHVEQLLGLVSRRGARASLAGGSAVTSNRWLELRRDAATPLGRANDGGPA